MHITIAQQTVSYKPRLITQTTVRSNLHCQSDEVKDHHGNKRLALIAVCIRLTEVGSLLLSVDRSILWYGVLNCRRVGKAS